MNSNGDDVNDKESDDEDLLQIHEEKENQEWEVSDAYETDDTDNDGDDDPDYVETGPVTKEHFDFLKRIGAGAFGTVFLVQKNCGIDNGRIYAVKVISKDVVAKRKKSITHVMEERKALELLRGCPYTPNLHYSFQTDDKLFLVLDYIPGGEMFTLLQKGVLDERRVTFYVAELVVALEHIHKHGIVYRDIKLENVLIDADGHIKLVDFGLCKHIGTKRRTYSICGTPEYMAPEVFNGKDYGMAADWWAVGVFTIELLTGETAFGIASRPSMMNEIRKRITVGEPNMPQNISHEMKDFILKMLNKDPLKRLGNDRSLATDIKTHPLFYGMDWNKLEVKELPASYEPTITDAFDVQHFSDEFTSQSADYVPSGVPKHTFSLFKGYSYIAPELERVDSHDNDNIDESLRAMAVDVFNDRQQPKSKFFRKYYFTSDKPIGYGTTSVCMKCQRPNRNKIYAVKIYNRKENCDTQIEVLEKCASKNIKSIVRLIEVITDNKFTYLVMDFIDSVNLLQHLNATSFNGKHVCAIFVALSNIVKQVHSLNYSHGRVCFKNIRCSKNSADIRLIGFSYAQPMTERIDRNIDFWSIGVCLYTVLCGHSPFQMLPRRIAGMANSIQKNTFNQESTTWTQLHEETRSLLGKLLRGTISNLSTYIMKSIVQESCSPLNNAEFINENRIIISLRAVKKRRLSEVCEEENDGIPVLVKSLVLNGDAILKNDNNSIESTDLHSTHHKSRNGKNTTRERHRWITSLTDEINSHEVSSAKSLSTSTSTKAKRTKMNASKRQSPKFTDELSPRKTLDQQIKKESDVKIQLENIRETASGKTNVTKGKLLGKANLKPETKRRSKSSTLTDNTTDESMRPPSAKSRRINNENASTRRDITSGPIMVENGDTVNDVEKDSTPNEMEPVRVPLPITYTSTAKECADRRVRHLELGVREHTQFVYTFPKRERKKPWCTCQRFDYK